MAISKLSNFELAGSTIVLPANMEDNSLLEGFSELEKDQLILHTGIKYRRVANPKDQILKYFQSGIEKLMGQLNWEPSDIDVLICVTQTINTPIPSLACQLHGDIGLPQNTLCFDINSGCSGYVYGLHTAMSLMNSLIKPNSKAILCCGDFSSQLINRKDKSTLPIFSDAISVTGIIKTNESPTSYFNLETEGSGKKAIYVEDNFMNLNGIDVFNYSLKLVPNHLVELFNVANISNQMEQVVIFHQANKLINDALIKRLKLNPTKTPSTLFNFGNTASASIPLTLGTFHQSNPFNTAILCGFGVGFSLASALIHLASNYSFSIIEK
jgi:3-oxoacyl-[acyl-carrier-protein] synthase III